MTIDSNSPSFAQLANGPEAKAVNSQHVADLGGYSDSAQQAEHIRGVVAATMSQLSKDATPVAREQATRWQAWALGLADGLGESAMPVAGLVA